MSYRRALLFRWSRRDRLAVLVIAVTVAFLVGSILFITAAGTQTATIAADFDAAGSATYYDSPAEAEAAAPEGALVVPVAAVTDPDGEPTYAAGVPPGTNVEIGYRSLSIETGKTTHGDVESPTRHELRGETTTTTVEVTPRGQSLLPPSWYLTTPAGVETLGQTGALVVDTGPGATGETPLRSVLAFFLAGTRQALDIVGILTLASGLLVGITAYSTTRMTVIDRLPAIRVVRSTGGTARTVIGLFAARGGLLGAVGAALGYAIGVIAASAAVNLAVAIGLPTSLNAAVTREVATLLVPLLVGLTLFAALTGALASRAVAIRPPGRIGDEQAGTSRLPSPFRPRLLEARILIPTTATLTAFVVFALVFAAAGGAAAPLVATDDATVSNPEADHPVNSRIPAAYGDALRAQGITASEEVLLFAVRSGDPVPARGVDYEAFADLSDAHITEGRPPRQAGEAVVSDRVTAFGGVELGEYVLVGGSTRPGVTRVEIVGRYRAPGAAGAQLLVPLSTARHLAGVGDEEVHVVRADRLPESTGERTIGVTEVSLPSPVPADQPFTVQVSFVNEGPTPATGTVPVSFGDQTETLDVELPATGRTTRTVTFDAGAPGKWTLSVGDETRTVTVVPADALQFRDVPGRIPTDEEVLLRVVDATGEPAANVTVRVGNQTATTDASGIARLSFATAGARELIAGEGPRAATTTVAVAADAESHLLAGLGVRPASPDLLVRPNADLRLANPWSTDRTVEVTIVGPAGETTRMVTIESGGAEQVTRTLDRQPPGTYIVTARVDGRLVAERRYEVGGDERIANALATAGRTESSPLGDALAVAFGNLQVVVAALVGLAGLMTVGATTAAFASAVHARRRTLGIYRATGGHPRAVLRVVLADAARLGGLATLLAIGLAGAAMVASDAVGLLAVFGVRLLPSIDLWLLAVIAVVAMGVALLSAGLATVAVLSVSPSALLRGETGAPTPERSLEK